MDMNSSAFDDVLFERLANIQRQNLERRLRWLDTPQAVRIQIGGESRINFSSNDYLGLANDPALKQQAADAIARFGAGSGSSRLICGSLPIHRELEQTLAQFKESEAALTFSSGYAAALGAITALVGKGDVVVIDRLAHACIVDAARLSGARLLVYAHNDMNQLERILRRLDQREPPATPASRTRVLIVTESVFSMDGDHAPLRNLADLKDRYGAWLMVDEAHATGLYGKNRRGLLEEQNVSGRIEVQMGTLSKAIGSCGGFICGSHTLINYLVNRARSFIFSTAPSPACVAAAIAAVRLIESPEGASRRAHLWQLAGQCGRGLTRIAHETPPQTRPMTRLESQPGAIHPWIVGDEIAALQMSALLEKSGFLVPAIRFPTVAKGAARLRITLSSSHTPADVESLLATLAGCQRNE
jgi:8-amino-7-oxononanoate synthase